MRFSVSFLPVCGNNKNVTVLEKQLYNALVRAWTLVQTDYAISSNQDVQYEFNESKIGMNFQTFQYVFLNTTLSRLGHDEPIHIRKGGLQN